MTSKRTQAYLALLTTTIIWGAALPIVKSALAHVSAFHFLFLRYAVAAPLTIIPLYFFLTKKNNKISQISTIVLMEFLGITIALSFLYLGLSMTTSVEAGLLGSIHPLLITLGGYIFFNEKIKNNEKIGLFLATIGMLLLVGVPFLLQTNGRFTNFQGNLLVLCYPVCWSAYLLLAKKYYKKISKTLVGFISIWVGLISFAIITITFQHLHLYQLFTPLFIPSVLIASLYMGVLGSLVALTTNIIGNDLIETSEASMFSYLQPLITIPLSILLLNEKITLTTLVSLILITFGVIWASLFHDTKRKLK